MGRCKAAISIVARLANMTKEARRMMEGWNAVIQFELTGESPFYARAEDEEMHVFEGRHDKPDAVIRGKASVFYDVLTGKIDQDEAYMTKRLETVGSMVDVVKFRRVGEATQHAHETVFNLFKLFSWALP